MQTAPHSSCAHGCFGACCLVSLIAPDAPHAIIIHTRGIIAPSFVSELDRAGMTSALPERPPRAA